MPSRNVDSVAAKESQERFELLSKCRFRKYGCLCAWCGLHGTSQRGFQHPGVARADAFWIRRLAGCARDRISTSLSCNRSYPNTDSKDERDHPEHQGFESAHSFMPHKCGVGHPLWCSPLSIQMRCRQEYARPFLIFEKPGFSEDFSPQSTRYPAETGSEGRGALSNLRGTCKL